MIVFHSSGSPQLIVWINDVDEWINNSVTEFMRFYKRPVKDTRERARAGEGYCLRSQSFMVKEFAFKNLELFTLIPF
jgi:hypothetical protein